MMVWVPVAALVIFLLGLGVVVRDVVAHRH
jgi:hypothetical protein